VNGSPLVAALQMGRLDGVPPLWAPHPKFAGVEMCRLVDSADSGGALTTLLVQLKAGAEMAAHRHEKETEQHIVLEGDGMLCLAGESHVYRQGRLAIIPCGTEHAVVAGEGGMVLLAVFSPAA
jgi:quercetin dioxygenase-like cupin family protein